MKKFLLLLFIGLSAIISAENAYADLVTYNFTTTVFSVDPSAPDFPAALNSVQPGDTISGTLTYESTSPTRAPFRLNNTTYELSNFSFSVNVGSVTFGDPWPGFGIAEIWDNDSNADKDGVIFSNVGPPGERQFQLGNINLPLETISSESLPDVGFSAPAVLALNRMGNPQRWIRSDTIYLQAEAVPIPGAVWLLGTGLIGIFGIRRKFKK
jgi:hypothetical protein